MDVELYCTSCRALLDAGDGIDTRPCWCCGATGCRHEMRKARVRIVGGEWTEQIACRDWAPCIMRCARKVIDK